MIANKVATKIQIIRKLSENIEYIFDCAVVWQYERVVLLVESVSEKSSGGRFSANSLR